MSRSRDISIILGATEETNTANTALGAGGVDSSATTELIDSSYVQLRQTVIDSSYVQLRQTAQDFAYSSLTGTPTIPALDTDFVDSSRVEAIVDSSYVSARAGGSSGGLGDYGVVNSTAANTASATGAQAIAIGRNSVASGSEAIAIGDADATGQNAIGIGTINDASGAQSVSIGYYARDGYGQDVAIGNGAYANSGNPGRGIAIGHYAIGKGIAIGAFAETYGNRSTAIGYGESTSAKTYAGNEGTAVGFKASVTGLYGCAYGANASATSSYDHAFGRNASATTGGGVAIGQSAVCGGSGSFKEAIGYGADALAANSHAYGYSSYTNTNNQFVLGNSQISDLRCQDTSITAVSDRRDKTQIEDLSIGLDFVNAITPKAFYKNNRADYYTEQYTLEQLEADSSLSQSYAFDSDSYVAATEKYDKKEFGWIAQDVAAELPAEYSDARVSFEEIDPRMGFDVQRFTSGDMVPILWKALRELSDKYDALDSDHTALVARVTALENA